MAKRLYLIFAALGALTAAFAQGMSQPASRDSANSLNAETRRTGIVVASERIMPSVVSITVLQTQTYTYSPSFVDPFFEQFFGHSLPYQYKQEIQGLGSGMILSQDGKIITNAHVVKDATKIKVTLADGRNYDVKVLGIDEALDLALLELQNPPKDLKPASLGTSDDIMRGEWVIALGNPFGFLMADAKPSVTVGVVSAVDRKVQSQQGKQFNYTGVIQTDAAINPGNSGGPLVNILGEVIGINTFIFTQSGGSEGLGFAIPIDQVKKFIYELKSHETRRTAWLGLGVQTLTSEMARAMNIKGRQGLIITGVFPGTPAAQKGLSEAWVITTANGVRYTNEADWQMMETSLFVGDTVKLEGFTDEGKVFSKTLHAAEYSPPPAERLTELGADVSDLDPATRNMHNIQSREGAYISKVDQTGLAAKLGLAAGDVILAYGSTPVTNVSELKKALKVEHEPRTLIIERGGGRYRLYRSY